MTSGGQFGGKGLKDVLIDGDKKYISFTNLILIMIT